MALCSNQSLAYFCNFPHAQDWAVRGLGFCSDSSQAYYTRLETQQGQSKTDTVEGTVCKDLLSTPAVPRQNWHGYVGDNHKHLMILCRST
jgi:hypothetical protein